MSDMPNVLNQWSDDPRLLLSEPFRAVHFVFGLFHPGTRPLSGRALMGSLETLGFGDGAARGTLLRLRRSGFLESRRTGREAVYTASPRSRALLDEIAQRSTQAPPPWDGAFQAVLVRVPDTERAFREQLRRHAAYAGFGSPSAGLLIAPYEASLHQLEPLLERRPSGAQIATGRLAMTQAEAMGLAQSAWDLEAMAATISFEAGRMSAAADVAEANAPVAPGAALQVLWASIGPFFAVISASPPLPAALLPEDWPMDAARRAFFRLAVSVAGSARQFVETLDEGHGLRSGEPATPS
jgi:DNA-binding transcriptional regulator PaaX